MNAVTVVMIVVLGLIAVIAISAMPKTKISEFSPPSSTGMQCVALEGTGLYCWPKIMNDEVQRWMERGQEGE